MYNNTTLQDLLRELMLHRDYLMLTFPFKLMYNPEYVVLFVTFILPDILSAMLLRTLTVPSLAGPSCPGYGYPSFILLTDLRISTVS